MASLVALVWTGMITFYAPGLMEDVYNRRLAWGQVQPCPQCIGLAAVPDCGRIGRKVWLNGEGPFLVVDCSTAAHRAGYEARGLVAEVDWPTARRWEMTGPIRGRAQWTPPWARWRAQ
jgi:hypothetical protein